VESYPNLHVVTKNWGADDHLVDDDLQWPWTSSLDIRKDKNDAQLTLRLREHMKRAHTIGTKR
jgi:hypothetical protein